MKTEILLGGDAFCDRLCHDIAAARESVWIQTLTFEGDAAGSRLAQALERSNCTDRRLLIDSFTRYFISDRFVLAPRNLRDKALQRERRETFELVQRLCACGVSVAFTNPAGLFLQRLAARDHKKLIVIDDAIAYLGGINFSDHNFAWRDLMIRIEDGAVARYLASDFAATWDGSRSPHSQSVNGVTFHNLNGEDNATRLEPVLELIRSARDSIQVVSPYITNPFCAELRLARERGVAVTLLGTAANNRGFLDRYVRWEAHRSGFELRLYPGRMNHMKAMLVDRRALVLGSSNFDWLSHSLQGEIVAVFTDPGLIHAFERVVLAPDLADSVPPKPVHPIRGRIAAFLVDVLAGLVPRLCPPRRGRTVVQRHRPEFSRGRTFGSWASSVGRRVWFSAVGTLEGTPAIRSDPVSTVDRSTWLSAIVWDLRGRSSPASSRKR